LHDASEAYCSDLCRPLKYANGLEGYRRYEKLAMNAVCIKFGLPFDEPADVKEADQILLATEGRDLMGGVELKWGNYKPLESKIGKPMLPDTAEAFFKIRFEELQKQQGWGKWQK
jgi:hypothetical protein